MRFSPALLRFGTICPGRLGKTFALSMLTVATLLWLPAPCRAAGEPGTPAGYHGTGVVVAVMPAPSRLHATRPVLVIHHAPILPLMAEEMDMPFLVASPALLEHLHAGDRITFTLEVTSDALLVVAVERVGPSVAH
jgi:copper binding protein CusF